VDITGDLYMVGRMNSEASQVARIEKLEARLDGVE
jgi:hypothetical protein